MDAGKVRGSRWQFLKEHIMNGLLQIGALVLELDDDLQKDAQVNKHWLCENGHILGVSVRVKHGRHSVDRLLKFRNAVDLNSEAPAEVDVDCEIEGTVFNIRCNIPGCKHKDGSSKPVTRTWQMGAAALDRFLDARKKRNA